MKEFPIQGAASEADGRPPLRRILVTGGAGFIGANLTRYLLDRGYEVTVLDNLSEGSSDYLEDLPIAFLREDILSAKAQGAIEGHDAIVHLAAQTGVPASLANPQKDCEINVLGTLGLLEACRRAQAKSAPSRPAGRIRFVLASSNAPLGRQTPPASEDKAPLPISPYGASKLAGEAYCLAYHGSWSVPAVALRFGNVYGPYSAHKSSVVAKFFQAILAGMPLVVNGEGGQTRDFIYVGDLCRAIAAALESEASGEIFQIATGIETSIADLARMVQQAAASSVSIESAPARAGDIERNYSSIGKAKSLLGWQPAVSLERGLAATWRWFRETGARSRLPARTHRGLHLVERHRN
ncbi:MAG TPA: NAD-dependent epimerase/dehydratase family protein [Candidatus Sulfotelmatobacter sp.]|nr:NAD-dependent epimerase/dehydratase family protein [Candidatus Sulfotelmatobacter sp.]